MDVENYANNAAQMGGKAAAVREVEVMLAANTDIYQKEMGAAQKATDALIVSLERFDKVYKATLKGAGKALIGIGASAKATTTAAMWSAAAFEDAFARVAKTTGLQNSGGQLLATLGIGDNALQQFNNDIRMLSTQIPVAREELAHLADVAGTLGVRGREDLLLFTDTAAKLGSAINDLSSEAAIEGLSRLMGAFGDEASTVTNLGSSLADLANKTRGSANEMLYFADRLSGTAVQAGMTSEQVLGLGAAVSSIGVQPELGASAIIEFLTKVSLAVQRGGDELDRFSRAMGMTNEQMKSLWDQQGGAAVLTKFLQVLSSQGQGAAVTLETLGLRGIGVTQVLGGLAAQMDVVTNALYLSNEAYEEGVAVAELAEVRFDTVMKAFQRFRQSMSEALTSIGQGFLSRMKMMFGALTGLVNVFNNLPQPIKTLIGMFMGFGATIVTVVGGLVLLYAQFHLLWTLLHHGGRIIPALVRGFGNLAKVLTRFGAIGMAKHVQAIGGAMWYFNDVLTSGIQSVKDFVTAMRAHRAAVVTGTTDVSTFAAAKAYLTAKFNGLPPVITDNVKAMRTWVTSLQIGTRVSGSFTAAVEFMNRTVRGGITAGFHLASDAVRLFGRTMMQALIATPGALGAIARTIHAGTFPAVMKLSEGFGFLTGKILKAVGTETTQSMRSMVHYLFEMSKGLRHVASAASAGFVKVFSFLGLIGKFALMLGAVGAAIGGVVWLYQKWQQSNTETASSFNELATAMGHTVVEIKDLTQKLDKAANSQASFAEKARRTLAEIKSIREELGEAAAEQYIIAYGLMLMAGGTAPSEIDAELRELRRLSDMPIVFTYSFEEATTGEGFRKGIEAAASAGRGITATQNEFIGMSKFGFGNTPEDEFGTQWTEYLNSVKAAVNDNFAARLVVMKGIQEDLAEALEEGEIGAKVFQWASEELDRALTPQVEENLNAIQRVERAIARAMGPDPGTMDPSTYMREYMNNLGVLDFQSTIADAMEDESYRLTEQWQMVKKAVTAVTGETTNLGDVVRNMSEEDVDKLGEKLLSLATDMDRAARVAPFQNLDMTGLERELLQGRSLNLDDAGLKRYETHVLDTYHHTVGLQRALAEAHYILEKAEGTNEEWGEEMDRVRQYAKKLGEELSKMRIKDLQAELKAMSAAAGVQHLISAIRALRAEMDPRNTATIQEMLGMLPDQRDQATADFRLFMDEYQRLLDQREELQRSHGERMQRMVEDRQKALANAQENYQDRLENIAKQEKEALEERVEQVAKTYGMLERLQSQPTQSAASIISNVEAQTRALETMRATVARLRDMGLSEEVMEAMGLNDPRNVDQAERFLQDALANPALIQSINDKWQGQLDVSGSFVDDVDTAEITERYDEARQEAKEALDESIADIHENYRENVAEATEAHAEQIAKIGEALAKLGTDTAKSIPELIKQALDSGLTGVQAAAEAYMAAIQAAQYEMDRNVNSLAHESLASREHKAKMNQGGKSSAQSAIDGFQTLWNNGVIPTARKLATTFGVEIDGRISEDGVEKWLATLLGFKGNQDAMWQDLADGAFDQGFNYVDQLAKGIESGIDRVVAAAAAATAAASGDGRGGGGTAGPSGIGTSGGGGSHYVSDYNTAIESGNYAAARNKDTNNPFRMGSYLHHAAAAEDTAVGSVERILASLGGRFPNLRVNSRYRMHDVSANSYHMDTKNPAADLGFHPRGDARETGQVGTGYEVFNFIAQNFAGKGLREMFFGNRGYNMRKGFFTPSKAIQDNHWDHVHVANMGGPVPGQGNIDNVPALLTPGEYVIRKDAVKEYGVAMMEQLNARKYATGGRVGTSLSTRGREPVGTGELAKAFSKALAESGGLGAKHETNFGPIEVKPTDAGDLIRQLQRRKRMANLVGTKQTDG